jgi:MFS family permease
MTFIDGTVVNVALPALQAGLHATITDVQWVVEAYTLFLGALILVGGSMGDQFGRKRVFLLPRFAGIRRDPRRLARVRSVDAGGPNVRSGQGR